MAQAHSVRQRQLQVVCRQPGCQKLFQGKKEMEQHWVAKHSTSSATPQAFAIAGSRKKVACNDCGKRFEDLGQLQQHAAASPTHMQVGRAAHSRCCEKCPRENFSTVEALEHHRAACHAVEELPVSSPERQLVEAYFKRKWLNRSLGKPTILSVLRIYNEARRVNDFEGYRRVLKVKANEFFGGGGERDETTITDGNEVRRFHGTTVLCNLGVNNSKLCNEGLCSLCGIIRNGFRLKKVRAQAFQRFGPGIYCTATSSKAHGYVRAETGLGLGRNAMFVCKVLAGRVYKTKENMSSLLRPPLGFDSVAGEPGVHLNYDELVLYDDKAILPRNIVIYECSC